MNDVTDALKEAADLFEERDEKYGSSYKKHGRVMRAFFPQGLELSTENEFGRFAIFNMLAGKLGRYANNFEDCGHKDSLDDISVYAQMLNDLDGAI